MLMPRIFGENLFDEMMNDPFNRSFFRDFNSSFANTNQNVLKTDVKEQDGHYELSMELPGYKKEDVKATLENGYLTVCAVHNDTKEEKDHNGNFIRRERYSGQCSRSFYVGDQVTQDEIRARFENGVLDLIIPKKEKKEQVPEHNYIAIEG